MRWFTLPLSTTYTVIIMYMLTAASMLIRNMLRVNAERRADIYDIATHWWLNMQDGTPSSIIDLTENQVGDTLICRQS